MLPIMTARPLTDLRRYVWRMLGRLLQSSGIALRHAGYWCAGRSLS